MLRVNEFGQMCCQSAKGSSAQKVTETNLRECYPTMRVLSSLLNRAPKTERSMRRRATLMRARYVDQRLFRR